jgi:hypothetical protein
MRAAVMLLPELQMMIALQAGSATECKQRKAFNKVLDVLFELSIIAMQLHADASTTPSHRKTCVPADTKSGKV